MCPIYADGDLESLRTSYADPAQPLTAAGGGLDDLTEVVDRDIFVDRSEVRQCGSGYIHVQRCLLRAVQKRKEGKFRERSRGEECGHKRPPPTPTHS